MRNNKRILELDYLKGFAILAVVFTHCLQYVFGESFENPVFNFVYSFHMPLFIIISGMLLYPKLGGPWNFILRRMSILLPCFTFGGTLLLFRVVTGHNINWEDILRIPSTFWFLSSLFVCSTSFFIAYKITGNNTASIALLMLFSFTFNIGTYNSFMIPFLGVGIIMGQHRGTEMIKSIPLKYAHMTCLALLTLYWACWDSCFTIYKSPCPHWGNATVFLAKAYLFRIVMGMGLSLILLRYAFAVKLPSHISHTLQVLSKDSLGIYVIHMFVFIVLTGARIIPLNIKEMTTVYLLNMVITTILVTTIVATLKIIKANSWANLLITGTHAKKN